jgi:ascorbate-specific PTS system EIIC-type component UlaA
LDPTENVSIPKGVVNNATATVHEIECSIDGTITSITMQLTNTEVKMKLKRQAFQHKYTYEAYYYKASFLIVLAYAITSHKSQGATIASNVLIDIRKAFSPRLTYIMLSRVTNRKNMEIRRTLSPTNFTPSTSQIE